MIYRITWESHFTFANTADYPILKSWKSPSPKNNWHPVPIKPTETMPTHDVMGLHQIMLWSKDLVDELSPLLMDSVQALPVVQDTQTLYAIHVTHVLDCLHQEMSQFRRFKNRNIGVEHYVLRADCLDNAQSDIFTLPDDGYSTIFVSDTVKQRVDNAGWSGLAFHEIELG